jgi:hypothetical protein
MRWCAIVAATTVLFAACRRAPPPVPVTVEWPPPVRPAGTVAVAHIHNPRAALDAFGSATETHHPADLMLMTLLGLDVAVTAAVDTQRPMDVVFIAGEHPGFVIAMTPPGQGYARSQLSSRYRFMSVANLGEILTPRVRVAAPSNEHRMRCALVHVAAPISTRLVCGSDDHVLQSAGRFAAYESTTSPPSDADIVVRARNDDMREAGRTLRDAATRTQQTWLADANRTRREREREPDYGDPEPLILALGNFARDLADTVTTSQEMTLHVSLRQQMLQLQLEVQIPSSSQSRFAVDARARCTVPREHPLATMLPADSVLAMSYRGSESTSMPSVVALLTRVLGTRVSSPSVMQADLAALMATTGDAVVFSTSPDSFHALQYSLAFSLHGETTAARAVLSRIANASWLRTLRLGHAIAVTPVPDGFRIQSANTTEDPSLSIGVRANALIAVLGRNSTNTLNGFATRTSAPLLPWLAEPTGSIIAGFPTPSSSVRFSYTTRCDEHSVHASAHMTFPTHALGMFLPLLD